HGGREGRRRHPYRRGQAVRSPEGDAGALGAEPEEDREQGHRETITAILLRQGSTQCRPSRTSTRNSSPPPTRAAPPTSPCAPRTTCSTSTASSPPARRRTSCGGSSTRSTRTFGAAISSST